MSIKTCLDYNLVQNLKPSWFDCLSLLNINVCFYFYVLLLCLILQKLSPQERLKSTAFFQKCTWNLRAYIRLEIFETSIASLNYKQVENPRQMLPKPLWPFSCRIMPEIFRGKKFQTCKKLWSCIVGTLSVNCTFFIPYNYNIKCSDKCKRVLLYFTLVFLIL